MLPILKCPGRDLHLGFDGFNCFDATLTFEYFFEYQKDCGQLMIVGSHVSLLGDTYGHVSMNVSCFGSTKILQALMSKESQQLKCLRLFTLVFFVT